MCLQTVKSKKTYFWLAYRKPLTNRAGPGSGSITQWYGSADPNPYLYENVTDPQHCLIIVHFSYLRDAVPIIAKKSRAAVTTCCEVCTGVGKPARQHICPGLHCRKSCTIFVIFWYRANILWLTNYFTLRGSIHSTLLWWKTKELGSTPTTRENSFYWNFLLSVCNPVSPEHRSL